jgi:hypothetical protein
MRIGGKIVAASLLAMAYHDASAFRLDYSVELGFLHSDNINLSASDPVSEDVLIPHLDFHFSQAGSTVQADVTGALEYRDYLGNTFGNEFRSTLNGTLNWILIPERLAWTFADNLGLYPINLRDPGVPGNLQQTNVFTTGPTLRFRLAPTMRGQAELRYIDSYAEDETAFNSQRVAAAFRLFHDLSATRHLSGNFETQDIRFDNSQLATDYKQYSAYAGYTQALARIDLDLALGYSYLQFDHGGDASGPLARASASWRATERSTFGVGFAWQYSDAAAGMLDGRAALDLGLGGIGIGGAMISPDVYRERSINGTYSFQSTRLNIAATLRAGTFRYEQDSVMISDRDEYGAGINLGYLLRPRTTLGVAAEATRRSFTELDASDRDYRYGLYLVQQMSRHWRWRVDLGRYERHANADETSFNENSIYLRLVYTR